MNTTLRGCAFSHEQDIQVFLAFNQKDSRKQGGLTAEIVAFLLEGVKRYYSQTLERQPRTVMQQIQHHSLFVIVHRCLLCCSHPIAERN